MPGRENSPASPTEPDQALGHEQGLELDIYGREAEAKRGIHEAAAVIMEHVRPGMPFMAILDVKRNETLAPQSDLYISSPEGSLRLLTPCGRREEGLADYRMMVAMVQEEASKTYGTVIDEAGQVRILQEGLSKFSKSVEDAEEPISPDTTHYVGVSLTLREGPVTRFDPSSTDERVVAIEETLAGALHEVADRIQATTAQAPDETAANVPDPAAANTTDNPDELGAKIAGLTRKFATDILDARGSKVSEDQDPALISYERETQVGGGRVREITEFLVPHDSGTNGVTIKYLSIYKHPNGGNTIIETLEGLTARVDVSEENGRVLDIERNEVSDVASRIAPQGFQPRPDLPEETQLHAKLSELQQNPGLVTLRLGYTTSRL